MKKIALDTNVFNFCYEHEISMENLSSFFIEKKLEPFVSPYVIYELSRIFTIDNSEKGKKLFLMLRELNPKYITRRDILYDFECRKLKTNLDFDYEADASISHEIENRIKNYSEGILPPCAKDFISERQLSLKETKQTWKPRGDKQLITKLFNNSFDCLIRNLFDLVLTEDRSRIDYIRKVISQATSNNIDLSDNEIITLISNMDTYPALVTLIRLNAYLQFLVEFNKVTPREDRFTDGLIMIEYSYCEIFLSGDNKLIDKHAKNINPIIELKKPEPYKDILKNWFK